MNVVCIHLGNPQDNGNRRQWINFFRDVYRQIIIPLCSNAPSPHRCILKIKNNNVLNFGNNYFKQKPGHTANKYCTRVVLSENRHVPSMLTHTHTQTHTHPNIRSIHLMELANLLTGSSDSRRIELWLGHRAVRDRSESLESQKWFPRHRVSQRRMTGSQILVPFLLRVASNSLGKSRFLCIAVL